MSISRYFIEVSYLGNRYAGFQRQANARTIQGELEKALMVFYRQFISLTGSSRTDAGVHAEQNYFHFDWEGEIEGSHIYNLNAILPEDIAIRGIFKVPGNAHCRFHALARNYQYRIYGDKDPFWQGRAYFFPYPLDLGLMMKAGELVKGYNDFATFSKRNTQVNNYRCLVSVSEWRREGNHWVYEVRSNRFLRGMVRGLVGTMLQVGRGNLDLGAFRAVIESGDVSQANFSVPGHGLYLKQVEFGEGLLANRI